MFNAVIIVNEFVIKNIVMNIAAINEDCLNSSTYTTEMVEYEKIVDSHILVLAYTNVLVSDKALMIHL